MTRDEMMAAEPDWQEAGQDFEGDEMTEEQETVEEKRRGLKLAVQMIVTDIRALSVEGCEASEGDIEHVQDTIIRSAYRAKARMTAHDASEFDWLSSDVPDDD